MDFDLPTDLIRQAQIGFREDAGVSSYDRRDTSLPSLPSVEASISALDPSPPYLRCKYCTGKLLRGLQSLSCIYCGQYQKKDLNPDPIAFKSTNGYRWLLQSLNLNGSERIGSLAEGSGINGGQSPVEEEITLSELLDLQILWRNEPEKPKTSFDNRTFDNSSSSMNYNASDLTNFFTGSERAVASAAYEEQPFTRKDDQSKDSGDQENLTFFQNAFPPEAAVTSSIDSGGDASSDWNPQFQSANSEKTNENSKLVDPFVGAEVDLSAHIDSVFGQVEEGLNSRNMNEDSHPQPSRGNDWIPDDLFANLSSANFQQADQFDSIHAKDGLSDHLYKASLEDTDEDWFNDSNWQTSNASNTAVSQQAEQLDIDTKLKDGSALDNPKDSSSEGVYVDWFEDSNWQKSTPINPIIDKDDDLFDIKPKVNTASSPSLVNDLIQNDLLNNVGSQSNQHSDKSNFNNLNKNQSDPTDWFQDDQWQIGASSAPMVASKDDDSFDEWNGFTSSTVNQDSFQDPWKQSGNKNATASEKMSEVSLFPSITDAQEVDFGNFTHSDLFSGPSTNKNPNDSQAFYDIFSEVSTANRNGNADAGNSSVGPTEKDEISTQPKNDVEILLSQMHDLSFMLNSELSIPSKADDVGPPHT